MAKNQVTEADLRDYYEQWQHLKVVHQAKQARYEPKPAATDQEAVLISAVAGSSSTL